MQWFYYIIIIPVGIYVFMRVIDLIFGRKPKNLGVHEGKLSPMKETPKGVNSYTDYDPQKMDPIPYQGNTQTAVQQMKSVLENLKDYPRIKFYVIKDNYIWARDISFFWRWKDDIEFYFDEDKSLIHFRSSPRYGYTDGGFNRERMEKIKDDFLKINQS